MKRLAIITTVIAVIAFIVMIAFGALGIWTGDLRFNQSCGLSMVVFVILALVAGLSWVGAAA